MAIDRTTWRFFHEHGVSWVGHEVEQAASMARAEAYADEQGWRFDWEWDQDADLSWCSCYENPRVRHDHDVEGCVLRDAEENVLASLWGIVDADRNYRRVIQAELAVEAVAAEQQVISDAEYARLVAERRADVNDALQPLVLV